jgi:hypothetical protein
VRRTRPQGHRARARRPRFRPGGSMIDESGMCSL